MAKQKKSKERQLIRRLNNIRHEQVKKIDILCKDMVSAHGDFTKQLYTLTFAVNFYENLLGNNDLHSILNTAAGSIKSFVPGSNVAIFLLDGCGFELHMVDSDNPIDLDTAQLESCFTQEVVDNICRANFVCSLDEMFKMGLMGNPALFAKISATAIPLKKFSHPVGFILIYRNAEDALVQNEIERICAITPGLLNTIESCQQLSQRVN